MDLPHPPMEDPAAAPDSWELADLDATMSRLLVSPSAPPERAPPEEDFGDELLQAAVAPSSSVDSGGKVSVEALNQVDQFLREALEKPRERLSILRMEQDIERFIRDPTKQELEFQALPTSYLRLAAHRVAQHYCLQSVAVPDNSLPDGSGSRIVIRKTTYCRFPPVRLADIPVNLPQEDSSSAVKFAIKQRPQKCPQTSSSVNTRPSKINHQRSVEERKEEYNRARARIFSGNNSGNSSGCIPEKFEGDITLPDTFPLCSPVSEKSEEKCIVEGPDINYGRSSGDSSTSTNKSSSRMEKEPIVSRYRPSNRVAIFRDREVDRKDPDYDRSYDRYMQRFDPGFGFNGGPYSMQAMYAPAVNYNTEFPQLGSGHRPQMSLEHQSHPAPQHMRGPWSVASAPNAIGYGPPECMMPPFSPNHVGAHQTSPIYLHSQYSVPPRAGMSYIHPHEHVQPFAQAHQQQPESNFELARPR